MGLDAPSEDLTARIQRKRRELLAKGLVEPARKGEFRGTPQTEVSVPVPQRVPDSRVVEFDETPERGGALADVDIAPKAEVEDDDGNNAEDDDGNNAEVGTNTVTLVNEFGEAFNPNEDGGFDLSPAGSPTIPIEEDAEIIVVRSDAPDGKPMKRKRASTALTAQRHEEILARLSTIEARLASVEALAQLLDDLTTLDAVRFDEMDAGLLVIAEFLAGQKATQDTFPKPKMVEIGGERDPGPIVVVEHPPRGRIARFFLG